MADAKPYRKLPGTGYRQTVPSVVLVLLFFVIGIFVLLLRGRRVQLWEGDDHLIMVDWDGAKEYYKRFYYRDIQAIVIRPTIEGRLVTILLGIIALFFWSFVPGLGFDGGGIVLAILGSLFLLITVMNLVNGPTCKCHVRTAVHFEELPSLRRLKHARRALEILRPRIAAAQGELPPLAAAAEQPAAAEMPQATGELPGPSAQPLS